MNNKIYTLVEGASRFWKRVDRNGPIPSHNPKLGPCWEYIAFNGDPLPAKEYGT